jgi:outer membrane protein assembly factor BamA
MNRVTLSTTSAALMLIIAVGGAVASETAHESEARKLFIARADRLSSLRPSDVPDDTTLEAAGAKIGTVTIRVLDVFDTQRPDENIWAFRTANRLHLNTRESTVRDRLLFTEGELYQGRLLQETERLLRDARYLYDASVTPIRYRDGIVDIEVVTRDVWTLNPGVSFGRKGGKNTSGFELEELNLLGLGAQINIQQVNAVDRDITSVRFVDRQLGNSWWGLEIEHSDFSDGGAQRLVLDHPFYSLDTRWAGGISLYDTERTDSRYDLGERIGEYGVDERFRSAYLGYSSGLQGDWVTRWTFGITSDAHDFAAVSASPFSNVIPPDRKLVYPWVGIDWVENDFRAVRNRDQIERTEDFQYGWSFGGRIGYSMSGLGADRDAFIFNSKLSKGFEFSKKRSLLIAVSLGGRYEEGNFTDTLLSTSARYYHRQSDRRLFFASLNVDSGEKLDIDRELMLGGDTGLRGFPLRYKGGQGRWLFTMEQRAFTDWYPFRLVHVGAAAFVDVGDTWGRDPYASKTQGILANVGIGLRLGNSRSALGNVLHIDLAFPINGDKSIKNMQLIIDTKRSF